MLIHSSNVGGKKCLAGVETLAQSPACRIDNRETPSTKATAPQREPGDICALPTQRTFLIQEEMVLAQTGPCCLLLPKKKEVTCDPSGFFLNGSVHLK